MGAASTLFHVHEAGRLTIEQIDVPFRAGTAAQQDFERIEAMNMEIGLKTAHDDADATAREKVSREVSRDHDSE